MDVSSAPDSTSSPSNERRQRPSVDHLERQNVRKQIARQETTDVIKQQKALDTMKSIQAESNRYEKEDREPWVGENGDIMWHPVRIAIARVLRQQAFDVLMGGVIIFNVVLIMLETDWDASCLPVFKGDLANCPDSAVNVPWLGPMNLVLLFVYTAELVARLYVERLPYFHHGGNYVDFFVVVAGWFSLILESIFKGGVIDVAILRVFRVARLTRAFRIFMTIRELYMLIIGIASAMKAIGYGMLLLFCMLFLWSILLVEFAHPVLADMDKEFPDCPACTRSFDSVMMAVLTLFQQIVTGDSWGLVSVPLIKKQPLLSFLLVAIVMTVSLGVMNLILAVIVDSATEAREADWSRKLRMKEKEQTERKMELLKVCQEMDKDFSGTITLDEMYEAYKESPEFRNVMAILEVREEELAGIFKILVPTGGAEISYKEFVDYIFHLQTLDVRVMLSMTNVKIDEISRTVASNSSNIQSLETRLNEHQQLFAAQQQLLQSIDTKLRNICEENGGKSKNRVPAREAFVKPAHGGDPLVLPDDQRREAVNGYSERNGGSPLQPSVPYGESSPPSPRRDMPDYDDRGRRGERDDRGNRQELPPSNWRTPRGSSAGARASLEDARRSRAKPLCAGCEVMWQPAAEAKQQQQQHLPYDQRPPYDARERDPRDRER